MHFYYWFIVIGLLFVGTRLLKRAWLTRHQSQTMSETVTNLQADQNGFVTKLTKMFRGPIHSLRNGFGSDKQANDAIQFRAWATSAFTTSPELHGWMDALTDEQVQTLIGYLGSFCRSMDFELEWLLENQLDQEPELMQGLEQIVLHYSQASYQAVMLQDEVALFRIRHRYLQNPKSLTNRALSEHLFGKFAEQGMSDVTLTEYLASSRRQRQQQIVETIQRVAAEHPQAFKVTLKSVVLERSMTEGEAESAAINGTVEAAATVAAD